MRVLTDPAETGAVTVCLPQDVQTEAFEWPQELFAAAHLARGPARARPGRPGPGAGGTTERSPSPRRRWAEASSTPKLPTPSSRSQRRLASPWRRHRPARVLCLMTTPKRWGPSARRGRRRPMPWPAGRCRRWHRHSLERFHHRVEDGVRPATRFVNCNITRFDAVKSRAAVVGDARWS